MLLHKPAGVVTTARDPHGRPTVVQLVRGLGVRAVPVGYTAASVVFGSAGLIWFIRRNPSGDASRTILALGGCLAAVLTQSILAAWELARPAQVLIALVMIAILAWVFFSRQHGLGSVPAVFGSTPPVEDHPELPNLSSARGG